jgi:hypothetical protein
MGTLQLVLALEQCGRPGPGKCVHALMRSYGPRPGARNPGAVPRRDGGDRDPTQNKRHYGASGDAGPAGVADDRSSWAPLRRYSPVNP